MSSTAMPMPVGQNKLLHPILIGGMLAASFDLTAAFITFGLGNPRIIAGGLLGKEAALGGAGTWILGVILHYSIAVTAAAVYCFSSLKLEFLKTHWLVCGIFFGIAVYLVMNLVVLPLSAYHYMGPYTYRALLQGILVHMLIVGLPISYSLRRFT